MVNNKYRLIIFSTIVLIIILIALLAPIIATHDPEQATLIDAIQSPSSEHWFGTDRMGRDLFSRVIFGARTSLSSTLILVSSIFLIGGILGVLAGYFGGFVDIFIMRISDMMVSFPGMALAIAMAGIMGPSITNAVIAITLVSWTKYARLARSLVLKVKYQDYILAAKMSGTRTYNIIIRYMLPSVFPTLIITAATDMGGMMLELAGFSFLGLGAQSTSIEWGYMLNEGRSYMESAPWLMVFPGVAIFITVVMLNLLGDSLRDILDPRDQSNILQKNKRSIRKMKKIVQLVSLIIISVIIMGVLSSCNGSKTTIESNSNSSKTETNTVSSHLNFGCYNYSDSLDPATNVNSSWCGVRYGITECLFKFSDKVVAEPNICDSYTVSEDYKTWILHIRDGVKFSNGNDVTASAVQASLERLYKETDTEQGGKGNSTPLGYLACESIISDDNSGTVTIVCETPTSNIPGILAYPYFAIVDTSIVDKEIVGTGPYKVDSIDTGVSIETVKNEHYWNGDVPFESITILFIEDSSTKAMALQSGDIDLVENITTASDIEKLSKMENIYISEAAGVRTGNSYLNYKGVLQNEALRQAVMMAVDRETLCNVTVSGMYTPGISVLPLSLNYNYDKLTDPYTFDKQNAMKLLDDAGIVDTDGDGWRELNGKMINLDSVAFTSRNLNEFAEATALLLGDIGIKVNVNIRDYDTALALLNAGEFDLWTCNTLTVGAGDPQDFLSNWHSKNSDSFGYYSNSEYDDVYDQLMVELDNGNRTNLITQLQQILLDDAANIVYGYYNSSMISNSDKVTGAEIATIDYYWITTDIKPVV